MSSNDRLGLNTLLIAEAAEDVALGRVLQHGFWLPGVPPSGGNVVPLHSRPNQPASQGGRCSSISINNLHTVE